MFKIFDNKQRSRGYLFDVVIFLGYMGSKICAVAAYTPETIVKNDDFVKYQLDTTDEWISKRTGISQRHISTTENTSDLATQAAIRALQKAKLSAEQIDFIIVATMSPDSLTPSTACLVQGKIGATKAFAFDINAACSGFLYALSVASSMMHNPEYRYGMVIGAEVMSKLVDWSDRSTSVLFGDGAGCIILESANTNCVKDIQLYSNGKDGVYLTAGYLSVNNILQHVDVVEKNALQMDGRRIFNFATEMVPKTIERLVAKNNMSLDDIDYFVSHQANSRMITLFAKTLQQPLDKFPVNIDVMGNTSAASIPILLDDMCSKGILSLDGSKQLVLTGFGGGLTWGAAIITV